MPDAIREAAVTRAKQAITGKRRAIVAALLATTIAACTPIGPDFVRPNTPVMKQWIETNTPAASQATGLTARSAPVVKWWETFNDPVLNRLVAQAYAQNLSLQVAGARVLQARAQLGIAFGELYPQSQVLGGSASKRKISENLGVVNEIAQVIPIDPVFSTTQVGFDAQWELDVWGAQRRGTTAAKANLEAQIANYDDALVTLTGDVAAVYMNIRALQELRRVAQTQIENQQKSLSLTQLRFDNGVTTELDVQEATTFLNNTKALIPGIDSDIAQSKNALAVLLGTTPNAVSSLVGSGSIPRARSGVSVGVPAELLRRRPDIRAAEMEAMAQAQQVGIAMANLYPQFILNGAVGLQASGGKDLFSKASATNLGSAGVVWPILNYGRIKNDVRSQDAAYQALIANYQNTVLSAYSEVESAMVAYSEARKQVGFYSNSVEASTKAAEIAVNQYGDGVADYTRVLNTQSASLRAQADLIDARLQVASNLVAVYKGLGGGWQIRQGREFLPGTVLAEMSYRTDWGDLLEKTPTKASLE